MKKGLLLGLFSCLCVYLLGQTRITQVQISGKTWVIGEIPVRSTTNPTTYTLSHTPSSQAISCYQNGLRQLVGANGDFTLSTNTINSPYWQTTDTIQCDYAF